MKGLQRLYLLLLLFGLAGCANLSSFHAPWRTLLGVGETDLYDKRLSQVEYPFESHFFKVSHLGETLEMHYMDVAAQGELQGVVVLFHGKNFTGAYWEQTARDLSAEGFRVIIPDQIGFGKSSKPLDFPYSFDELAFHTQKLLESLKISKVQLVGHSMGGMLATRFAVMNPRMTQGVALINPIGLEDWRRKVPYLSFNELYQQALKKNRESIIEYQKEAYYDGKWRPEYREFADHLIGWTKGPDRKHMALIDALTTQMIFTQPVLYDFDRVLAPTLMMVGTRDRTALGKDRVGPRAQAELGRYDRLGHRGCVSLPRCQLVELEGIGHMPQVEDYSRYIDQLISFLTRS